MSITLVTGGARSGKSRYAEKQVLISEAAGHGPVAYIATAIPFDDGMKDRIAKHQARRPKRWATVEQYKNFRTLLQHPAFAEAQTVLFDCLTVMITNQMMDLEKDWDHISMERAGEIEDQILKDTADLLHAMALKSESYIVTNEVGMGLVPAYRMGNLFRDIAGRVNQMVAAEADRVVFCVSGIPMTIKNSGTFEKI
ncbi:bifunctional adenosylcobinamide kinase/adenosylcobinamide-phosphate guanylyltransferase [Pseudoramibacter sp.]|jgi:adenosylcobinamide kinase/adenosylcobinamide-phosphate guanylyltransferase|uniref:bifunctional adenosylcobinamide kinase/adenosylcobinamide-phosphate guanylyltransferase n=1 Tax=Pseudoramibacter sp. TaxID=2034862 RepID=UPI0025F39782|nr:bifunctional adenosylcobinamide kinase/adenosylcobinamide-phosphate guanylyltransferase [Pseudoramibacter sp.]MCH4072220.1 bifunctional adenosylcobinamide kinase/adenosylcobinamide-phosphate guanylyltransferase [Pseudoramibacter sp.]MCH4105990.1 bifunctional adenosylcobinamide kinase/adenosylcobinamide-phosphate guanylyltransferase [Pseudoramibacter sp.]